MSDPNPYAPPQALEQPQQRPGGAVIVLRPYQSASTKTKVLTWLSVVGIAVQMVMMGACFLQLNMLHSASSVETLDQVAATNNDHRLQAVTGLLVLSMLACFVALLVWFYATHANLPALGAQKLDFTSGWAVGWFFVPIANLFKPYQVAREIWDQSQPNLLLGRPVIGPTLVGWWWGLRVVSGIAERAIGSISRNADTLDSLIFVTWTAIILTLLLDIPMLICQILLVRTVQRFQDERYELVSSQQPPPLPQGGNPFAA